MNLTDIENAINAAIPDATVHVLDPMNDGQHLQALVISPSFEGIPLVKQHKMVMQPLTDALTANIVHALGLKTFTPEKWEQQKDKYQI